ncbi:MAG: LuxR C-terminal-related transcriptional regulator [Coriobacteriales bacterium]|nr:LuxR C-terminal-related transcriptional regulator [Coriobacteriales bacterium]
METRHVQVVAIIQVACFFYWSQAVFRIVPSALIELPLGFFVSERRDLPWLTYLVALTLTALIALVLGRLLRRPTQLYSFTVVAIFTVFCIVGSILITCFPENITMLGLGGVACGIGIVGLAPAFYASLSRFTRSVLLTTFILVALCMALLVAILYLMPQSVTIAVIALCPAATGVSIVYLLHSAPKMHKKVDERRTIDDVVLRVNFRKNLLTCSFALLFSALFSCITGFATDALSSEQFLFYFLTMNIITNLLVAVILFLVRRILAFEFFIFVCFLVQATATLMLPFMSGGDSSSAFASALNAAAALICQIIFVFVVLQHDPQTEIAAAYDPLRALLAVLMTGATGIPSIFIGAAIYHYLGLNSSAIAIVAAIILYVIFLIFSVLTQKHKRVEHVLTGSFESEMELANYRSQILASEYPTLSTRELDVLALLLRGHSVSNSAEALCISENTVKSHIQHIYKKMGIRSRQELLKRVDNIPFD